jgi:hypothetical protein
VRPGTKTLVGFLGWQRAPVAVLLDTTIVRAVLLPAMMKLLGHRNW